jgi:uncharacterized protein (TIGR02145 family)
MQGIDRKYPLGVDYNARNRLTTIENYEFIIELWQNIGTNQTGTLAVPENTTIIKGQYPNNDPLVADEDALVAFADVDGKPTMRPAKASDGSFVFIDSLDADNGNFILTDLPTSAVTIYFFIKIKLKDWNNLAGFNVSHVRDLNNVSSGEFFFSYSTFLAEYADDIDYNDIIRCSLTATNNSTVDRVCTIYFKLGDYLVQQSFLIPALTSHIFTYDFEDVDIFQVNTVTFHNSAMQVVGTVPIAAYPEFEMFFDAQVGNMTANFLFAANDFCNVIWGDGTSDEIIVNGNYSKSTTTLVHTYSTTGLKRITFTNSKVIIFRVNVADSRGSQYYISDISQLRNIENLYLYASDSHPNVTISKASFRKATKKLDVCYYGSSIELDDTCFSAIVYSTFFIRYAYNFNVSADKLSEIMLYAKNFRIYSASINSDYWTNRNLNVNSLIVAPYIMSDLSLINCNLINIDRNSDFGDGNVYYFQNSNLLNEAIDNAFYVLVNTNNYTGTGAKSINLIGQSNGRRTVASDADYNALLALGWTITCYNPNAEPYGYLYNWFVVDTDRIAPSGTHIPTVAEYDTLLTFLGGASVAGGKMKEVGLTNWNTPNTGATNESGYTAIGTGYRLSTGSFSGAKVYNMIWRREESTAANGNRSYMAYNSAAVTINAVDKKSGLCLRCLLDDPSGWVAGDTITDFEGNVYQTVKIDEQVWLASDLRCTKYNDGEPIPHIVDTTLWASLVTPGYCSFNNT